MNTKTVYFRSTKAHGFSLIEMLVVVAVIAIIGAIAFPAYSKARGNAQGAQCLNQLRQLGIVFGQYQSESWFIAPVNMKLANPALNGLWYDDNSALTAYIDKTALKALAVCPANRSSKTKNIPILPGSGVQGGYPYVANYCIMPVNVPPPTDTRSPLLSRFQTDRQPSSLVMLLDTDKNWTDWGQGLNDVNDLPEGNRVGSMHGGKTNVLWLDGHVSPEIKKNIKTRNFRPDRP